MNIFRVNGVTYTAVPFTFNTVCDLEDMGIAMTDIQKKPMSAVRAYFAICTGKDKDFAGQEMEQHLINGGSFDDVIKAMSVEVEKSDFFRKMSETATETATAKKK